MGLLSSVFERPLPFLGGPPGAAGGGAAAPTPLPPGPPKALHPWSACHSAEAQNPLFSLLLVRPSAIKDGQLGQIIDQVLSAGVQIGNLQMMHA